eukprot:CAMPEP_0181495366 /NCGR_PEP_ID=MMETSP1110-20121109/52335_1 /TAXON_ID=174948 /ORGANISM="Symbiodinium sp., Strain CCMP421" /LENGTH=71 /DNA_ID=CAMNT_0023622977 /DNA_START=442 /DNA_END=653 /DNA_ORIENTATION=-
MATACLSIASSPQDIMTIASSRRFSASGSSSCRTRTEFIPVAARIALMLAPCLPITLAPAVARTMRRHGGT